jgi:hypothetical protein
MSAAMAPIIRAIAKQAHETQVAAIKVAVRKQEREGKRA